MRPSYTHRFDDDFIPRAAAAEAAAALEMAAAKRVIYCGGINQTGPSFFLCLDPSLRSSF